MPHTPTCFSTLTLPDHPEENSLPAYTSARSLYLAPSPLAVLTLDLSPGIPEPPTAGAPPCPLAMRSLHDKY